MSQPPWLSAWLETTSLNDILSPPDMEPDLVPVLTWTVAGWIRGAGPGRNSGHPLPVCATDVVAPLKAL